MPQTKKLKVLFSTTMNREIRDIVNQVNLIVRNLNENQDVDLASINQVNEDLQTINENIGSDLDDVIADNDHNHVEDIITYKANGVGCFGIVMDNLGRIVCK